MYKYRERIEQAIKWDLVQERLDRYPQIKAAFPIERLREFSTTPPYFSHFLTWRLGTYQKESVFEHLEILLANASKLEGWTDDKCTNYSPEFDHYFGLVWELQVAQLLSVHQTFRVRWQKDGPDLLVETNMGKVFVECYVYRKSFALELFIEELLSFIHPNLKIKHTIANKFSLQKENNLADFLENLFSPLLKKEFLSSLLNEQKIKWPVIVPGFDKLGVIVYLDGHNTEKFDSNTIVPYSTGDTDYYLEVAMKEAVNNKRKTNRSIKHRPNLLAVNFHLSPDYVIAADRRAFFQQPLPQIKPGPEFDGLLFTASGIDNLPKRDMLVLQSSENSLLWLMGSLGE